MSPRESAATLPPAPVEASIPPAAPPDDERWPRYAWTAVPSATVEVGGNVTDVDVAADGRSAWIVAGGKAHYWDFRNPVVAADGVPGEVLSLATSPFDATIFAIVKRDGWVLERWSAAGSSIGERVPLYTSESPLSDVITVFTRWNEAERVYFARAEGRSVQTLSVTRDGSRLYEVTSPSGKLGPLTAAEVREVDDEVYAPKVLTAPVAVPLSVDPTNGSLYWRDGALKLHEHRYDESGDAGGAINWGSDQVLAIAASSLVVSPNGYLRAAWSSRADVGLYDPAGKPVGTVKARFTAPPTWTPDGRALVGATSAGVEVVPVRHSLAPVRYLARNPDFLSKTRGSGLAVSASHTEHMYELYERWSYEEQSRPILATVDGLLEVLHAGFEAVFVTAEREVSAPRLRAFAGALAEAGKQRKDQRLVDVAAVTLELLDGSPVHEEAVAATKESGSPSALHNHDATDWADFHPRGPYATSPELGNYFRAFKYMNLLRLTETDRKALMTDRNLVDAWGGWVEVQQGFLQGSRYPGLLAETSHAPPWFRSECIKQPVAAMPFPLNWGLDSEALDRTVAHDDLAPSCGVPLRGLPTGLDWLVALGSPSARVWSAAEEDRYPGLAAVHDEMAAQFGKPLDVPGVVPGWWRAIQLLATEDYVPEGVDAESWRGRLAETALASWTSLRHTMVLVNERSVAEMGGPWDEGFELLSVEEPTHAVDPLPEVWAQIATLLGQLAAHPGVEDRVAELLRESSKEAADFGDMARRQMAGQALTTDEYIRIRDFGRTIEHPYVMFKTAAAGTQELSKPDPMAKIVDVHMWDDPQGEPKYFHVAVGAPRQIDLLVGDRGVLLPAMGAVYSYYEVVDTKVVDDEAWRARLDVAQPPAWSPAAR